MAQLRPEISIVIPAYNEEQRLGSTLARVAAFCGERFGRWEVIVVDDGSTDGTIQVAEQAAGSWAQVRLLPNARHRGKGYAVRRGVLAAGGEAVLLSDADLSTPIEELPKLQDRLVDGADIAIGSRNMPESEIGTQQPLYRRAMGVVYWWLRMLILPTMRGFGDTQCGFKLFQSAAAQRVFGLQTVEGFGFDPEVLHAAVRAGLRVDQVPIRWLDDRRSKVNPVRDSLVMLADLWRVRLHDRRGAYETTPGASGT